MASIVHIPEGTNPSRAERQRLLDTCRVAWRGGPPTCKTLESLNPGGCDGCSYKGKITTPIILGKTFTEHNPRPPELSDVPMQIWNADLWALKPDLAPPVAGPAFIELKSCWYPLGDKGDEFMRPSLMYYERDRIRHFSKFDFEPDEAFEGRFMHPWASWILSAAMSLNAHNEPTTDGWLISGTTRLTKPYRRICEGIYDGSGSRIEPTGYECRANDEAARRITVSGRGCGSISACIDLLFRELEIRLPAYTPASPIEDEFAETPANITRLCEALAQIDSSDYDQWFRGLCAIASLPWRQEVKERIACWWSRRTRQTNFPGDDEIIRKLNRDIKGHREGGITYRWIFWRASNRGSDGREN
jgi:hypothetical protein